MNVLNLDLNLLVLFDQIYRQGQLTLAADTLHLSQPAASHGLNRLRQSLNDPLFVRKGRTLQPTARATKLAPVVRQALDLIQQGVATHTEFEPATSHRNFNLNISHYGEVVILPSLLRRITESAPNIDITIHCQPRNQLVQGLVSSRLDLAIEFQSDLRSNLQQQRLMQEDFVTVVDASNPYVKKKLTIRKFIELPHVVYHSGNSIWIDDRLSQLGYERKIIARLSNFLSVFPLLGPTRALSTPPRRIAEAYADGFEARLFEPPFRNVKLNICQYWLPVVDNDPGHRWLRNEVAEVCAAL